MFSNFLRDEHSNLHFEGFAVFFFIFVFLMARIISFFPSFKNLDRVLTYGIVWNFVYP